MVCPACIAPFITGGGIATLWYGQNTKKKNMIILGFVIGILGFIWWLSNRKKEGFKDLDLLPEVQMDVEYDEEDENFGYYDEENFGYYNEDEEEEDDEEEDEDEEDDEEEEDEDEEDDEEEEDEE